MYLQYRYTNDTAYLQNTAYPFMREVRASSTRAKLPARQQRQVLMAISNAHETYWDVQERDHRPGRGAAAVPARRSRSATQLGLDAGLRAQWQNVLDNLVSRTTVSNGA